MKKKIRNRSNFLEIVERILYFNQLEQEGSGWKILTPNQMLSRLPIFFSSVKSSKTKVGKFCIPCTNQKNLQKMFIKVWLTLFKHWSNLYEH